MPPIKDKPAFSSVLRHLPLPHPLGQHHRPERDRREQLTQLLQDPALVTIQIEAEDLHALLTQSSTEPPQPAGWPKTAPLYIEARQPVMLHHDAVEEALGAPGDALYGFHVSRDGHDYRIVPTGITGLHTFDLVHRQRPDGRLEEPEEHRHGTPALERAKAEPFYLRLAARLAQGR